MLSIPGSEDAEWFEYNFTDYDPEELLIGQFHRFIDVSVPGWKEADRVHEIGQCTLWQGLSPASNDAQDNHYLRPFLREPGTRLSNDVMIINIEEFVLWNLPPNYRGHKPYRGGKRVKYVPLKHVETQVALGPMVEDLESVEEDVKQIYYAAMLLSV